MKRLILAVCLVALCAIGPVLAKDEPPTALTKHILSLPMIYHGECEVPKLHLPKMVCLIFRDDERDMTFGVMSDDGKTASHIVVVVGDKEPELIWVKDDRKS